MTVIAEHFIEIQLAYGTGADGMGEGKAVSLTGHRCSVSVTVAGGAGLGDAQVRIFGLSLSLMNELSTMGKLPNAFRRNTVTILAGDDPTALTKIFQGTIVAAWADFMAAPDVAFNITGSAGLLQALVPVAVSTYPGSADAAVILASLAAQMNLTFEGDGVSVILSKPYYAGSALAQAKACAEAAKLDIVVDNGVLAVWPKGGARSGTIPIVSPTTGMVGYPTYTSTGIVVTSLFSPIVRFGEKVAVESSLTPACGVWKVVTLVHDIEANMPGGKWFSQFQLAAIDSVIAPK
jgi:hypothetical protein